jgi:sulfur carrier protein ThiS
MELTNMTLTTSDFNCETGVLTERDMTAEEIKQYEIDKKIRDDQASSELNRQTTKAALLAKLGITAEEAALLLG